MRARYSKWDGSRATRLDPDKIFEALAAHLQGSGDLARALDELLRAGLKNEELQLAGLDELLSQVREKIKELQRSFNVDHALDRHRERLDEAVDLELEALGTRAGDGASMRGVELLHRLPRAMDDALDALARYDFTDAGAATAFEGIELEGDEVRKVERFVRRHGAEFIGKQSLGFEETLELIDKLTALRELERSLSQGRLDGIDAAALAESVGEDAARSLHSLREMLAAVQNAGYLLPRGERFSLSAVAVRKLGQMALREIFAELPFDVGGRHQTGRRGCGQLDSGVRKTYEFGDPMDIDVAATLRNAMLRDLRLPLRFEAGDFEVFESRRSTSTATVLLLDMSWSMSWEGRFAAAKRVALAMESLMRSRYPGDFFRVVGFYTRAVEIKLGDLPELTWNMGEPFTNLQDGLRLGRRLLSSQRGAGKQMIIITDGQPTAYFEGGRLFCEWPMSVGGLSTRATEQTLKEVGRVSRAGIVINTFMLDDSPPLRAFVDKMTAINKGRAFYSTPAQLGRFLLVDYMGRRRKVI